jgi:mRNA interferase MazF
MRTARPMPSFEQGDVVRVPFPYTDRSTRQRRPALVVSAGGIGDSESLLWVAMITSAENRPWPGDLSFGARYADAGLPAPSVIRPCKIATIEARHAEPLGRVKAKLMSEVMLMVRRNLGG